MRCFVICDFVILMHSIFFMLCTGTI